VGEDRANLAIHVLSVVRLEDDDVIVGVEIEKGAIVARDSERIHSLERSV